MSFAGTGDEGRLGVRVSMTGVFAVVFVAWQIELGPELLDDVADAT